MSIWYIKSATVLFLTQTIFIELFVLFYMVSAYLRNKNKWNMCLLASVKDKMKYLSSQYNTVVVLSTKSPADIDVDPMSATLAQHFYTTVGICHLNGLMGEQNKPGSNNTRDVHLMLVWGWFHRLRRWPSIIPASLQLRVFAQLYLGHATGHSPTFQLLSYIMTLLVPSLIYFWGKYKTIFGYIEPYKWSNGSTSPVNYCYIKACLQQFSKATLHNVLPKNSIN